MTALEAKIAGTLKVKVLAFVTIIVVSIFLNIKNVSIIYSNFVSDPLWSLREDERWSDKNCYFCGTIEKIQKNGFAALDLFKYKCGKFCTYLPLQNFKVIKFCFL